VYTYANLGSIPRLYPVPKPVSVSAKQVLADFAQPKTLPAPLAPATAGSQSAPWVPTGAPVSLPVAPAHAFIYPRPPQTSLAAAVTLVKERLFANPYRPQSLAAGGELQIQNGQAPITNFRDYFSDVLHLAKNQYTLKPLKPGATVVAGTILGRIAGPSHTEAPHLSLMVQPAGKNAPYIDPKPILDGWEQSNTLALPDHANRLQITYTPQFGTNKALSAEFAQVLKPGQWIQLISRISQIPEPTVPINASQYATKDEGLS